MLQTSCVSNATEAFKKPKGACRRTFSSRFNSRFMQLNASCLKLSGIKSMEGQIACYTKRRGSDAAQQLLANG